MVENPFEFFRSFDYFGSKLQFNYKGNEKYKTLGGALLSFMLNAIIIVFIYVKSQDLLMDT